MLKLSSGPFWLDIAPGVRIEFDPIDPAAFIMARHAARAALKGGGDDAGVRSQVAFTCYLAQRGIRSWEGVGDAEGVPVEPTRDQVIKGEAGEADRVVAGTISRLLNHYPAFEAIDRLYVGPVLLEEAEKNVSSPSRTGPTATATTTAEAAAKTTGPTAKPARSRSTPRKRKPASSPGT